VIQKNHNSDKRVKQEHTTRSCKEDYNLLQHHEQVQEDKMIQNWDRKKGNTIHFHLLLCHAYC